MKRILLFLVLVAVLVASPVSSIVQANPAYGGSCILAAEAGYDNPFLNASCYSFMEEIDECCSTGECPTYYCDTL